MQTTQGGFIRGTTWQLTMTPHVPYTNRDGIWLTNMEDLTMSDGSPDEYPHRSGNCIDSFPMGDGEAFMQEVDAALLANPNLTANEAFTIIKEGFPMRADDIAQYNTY